MTPLDRLARRVRDDPFFLAAALTAFAETERLDDVGLATRLGCALPVLTNLRLCRMPCPEAPRFWQDIRRIAERFGVDAQALAEMVRRGQSLLRFREAAPGTLWAARDRHEGEPS